MEIMSRAIIVSVVVNAELCVGSGTCAMLDPDHFEIVDGKSRVTSGRLTLTDELDEAIQDCPMQAIRRQS